MRPFTEWGNRKVLNLTLRHSVFYFLFILFYFILFIYLAVLGLCCCARAFFSCGKRGLVFLVVHGLLIVMASFVVEHRL